MARSEHFLSFYHAALVRHMRAALAQRIHHLASYEEGGVEGSTLLQPQALVACAWLSSEPANQVEFPFPLVKWG